MFRSVESTTCLDITSSEPTARIPSVVDAEPLRELARTSGIEIAEGVLSSPEDVARLAMDGIDGGEIEILDRMSHEVKNRLSGPPRRFDVVGALTTVR